MVEVMPEGEVAEVTPRWIPRHHQLVTAMVAVAIATTIWSASAHWTVDEVERRLAELDAPEQDVALATIETDTRQQEEDMP